MTSWPTATIGDIAASTRNALVGGPFGSNLTSRDYVGDGIPVIRGANMGLGRWVGGQFAYVTEEKADSLAANCAAPGDLLFTQRGTLGQVAIAPVTGPPRYLVSQSQMKLTIDGDKAEPLFVYYVFNSLEMQDYIRLHAIQTGVPHTNLGILRETPIPLPPMEQQRAIAGLLGALDDKIESNRRAIDLAETLADALFGQEVAREVELSSVAEIVMGSSPPGTSYNEDGEGMPFYQGVRDFGRRYPGHRVWTTAPVRVAQDEDTLLSVRAPVGELNRAREQCCIGRGVAAIRAQSRSTVFYALCAADALWKPFQQEGTVFGAINKTDLAKALILWPSGERAEIVESNLASIDARIRSLSVETSQLIELRDTLLPELLSGRIRVPEAREAVQEVVT